MIINAFVRLRRAAGSGMSISCNGRYKAGTSPVPGVSSLRAVKAWRAMPARSVCDARSLVTSSV